MKPNCERCSDDGLVFLEVNGRRNVYRCRCPAGLAKPEKLYRPSDKKREYPMLFPLVPAEPQPVGRERAAGKDD